MCDVAMFRTVRSAPHGMAWHGTCWFSITDSAGLQLVMGFLAVRHRQTDGSLPMLVSTACMETPMHVGRQMFY